MTIWKLALTSGPWHREESEIKDNDGNVIAKLSWKEENSINLNNAELMAAAPNLLAAAVLTMQTLAGMTTEQFDQGAANPVRIALVDTVRPFVRQTDSNGFTWSPGYDEFMKSMFGFTDDEA